MTSLYKVEGYSGVDISNYNVYTGSQIGIGWMNEVANYLTVARRYLPRNVHYGADFAVWQGKRDVVWYAPINEEDLVLTKKRLPPSPPPIKTMDKCCRESTKMIREIHKVLDTREILDAGLKVPNRLIATQAKGSQKLKTYLDI